MPKNPHKGSPLKSAYTASEWKEVEALTAKKIAAQKPKKRAKRKTS
jgi:hypothetical protein